MSQRRLCCNRQYTPYIFRHLETDPQFDMISVNLNAAEGDGIHDLACSAGIEREYQTQQSPEFVEYRLQIQLQPVEARVDIFFYPVPQRTEYPLGFTVFLIDL